jgi:hypothetical protein
MEDDKRGYKKKKRGDAADVWKKAAPFSEQRYHQRPPSRHRSPSGVTANDSGPFLNPAPSLVVWRELVRNHVDNTDAVFHLQACVASR